MQKMRWIIGGGIMIKKMLLVVFTLIMLVLCACGSDAAEAELRNTIDIPGTGVSISMPASWSPYDKNFNDEFWVMSISNADTGYADIFFTDAEEYDYSAKLNIQDMEDYYADNVIGSVEKLQINDMTAYRFEYSMVDIGEDAENYNFHGYEYTIDTPGGVLEIDIYYSQSELTAKIFNPSGSQLELLTRIAESVAES
jgi:hypothetical protein